ncbi:hypothetical protein O0L34_g3036 [Tuta absoluta]|nr:hypothetical protein O0L34_g3036 [Tuta absoluta]
MHFLNSRNCKVLLLVVCAVLSKAHAQPGKCDQQPDGTGPARDGFKSPYYLKIATETFFEGQTYVLELGTTEKTRPFKGFMITVEDPEVDKSTLLFNHQSVDVGTLKTLEDDMKTRYSEKCFNTVENKDISDKLNVTIHWVSPKEIAKGRRIRIRAMVAENAEVWYAGGPLNITLEKNDRTPKDSLPYEYKRICKLCSEARYEVIFTGQWSRGTHPLHYPSKPDDNMYSPMVGASHNASYPMWSVGTNASPGLRKLAENADISYLEEEILRNAREGTVRTLIRGKMHKHPQMSEPSHALFRVNKDHHVFSLVVAIKPSPDWFLGVSRYELCGDNGWLPYHKMPLFPYDAGTKNGVSYESEPTETIPNDVVGRVAVGSFDKNSPFYQINLNDLKPFAILEVRKLDEYPLADCSDAQDEGNLRVSPIGEEADGEEEEGIYEPLIEASKQKNSCPEDESQWSRCLPHNGLCGYGFQTRRVWNAIGYEAYDLQVQPLSSCREELETKTCFVNC